MRELGELVLREIFCSVPEFHNNKQDLTRRTYQDASFSQHQPFIIAAINVPPTYAHPHNQPVFNVRVGRFTRTVNRLDFS